MNFEPECWEMTLEGKLMHNQFADLETGTCLTCYLVRLGYKRGQEDSANGISQSFPANIDLEAQQWVFDGYNKDQYPQGLM